MESSITVRSMWDSIQARDWAGMRSRFLDSAEMVWPVTGELFSGADGIVAVNEKYPEGWSIHILSVDEMADGRVVSRVRVDHASQAFFAVSFYTLRAGQITRVEEYWSTKEEPEAWRSAQSIPGWSRTKRGLEVVSSCGDQGSDSEPWARLFASVHRARQGPLALRGKDRPIWGE